MHSFRREGDIPSSILRCAVAVDLEYQIDVKFMYHHSISVLALFMEPLDIHVTKSYYFGLSVSRSFPFIFIMFPNILLAYSLMLDLR